MKKASVLFIAIALAMFGLAACGGDDDDDDTAAETAVETTSGGGGGGAGETVDLSAPADGSLAFDPAELTAKAGTITVNFDNPASLSHDVVIEDDSGAELAKTDLVADGTTSTTADLQAGTYTYFCSVPGHREGGMEGTLTVN